MGNRKDFTYFARPVPNKPDRADFPRANFEEVEIGLPKKQLVEKQGKISSRPFFDLNCILRK